MDFKATGRNGIVRLVYTIKNRSPRRRLQKSDSPDDPHRLLWEGTIEKIERVVKTEERGGGGRGRWEKRERSPEFLSTILVPSLRAEMRWKTAPSWDRLTFSLLSTRILTSDFEHYCGSPIFQTCPNHGAGSRGNRARGNCTKLQMKKNVHRAEIPPARERENAMEDETRGRVF